MNKLKKYLVDLLPILSRFIKVNYGLDVKLEDAHAEDKDHVMGVFGITPWQVLKEDGDWTQLLPENELQKGRRFDTMGCTGYGLMNVLETLAKAKWGVQWNLSDRYINVMSGTGHNGNSMKRVLETVRKYGVVNEEDFTWDRDNFSWNDYYKRPNNDIVAKGQAWAKEYVFAYDKVPAYKQTMQEALKFSPLYVGLYAWYERGNLYYSVANANHVCEVYKLSNAYDTYDPFTKELAPNFKIPYVYRIYLEKKDLEYNLDEIKKLRDKGVKFIMRALGNGEVYELKDGLRKVSPQELRDMTIKNMDKSIIGVREEFYSSLLR